MFSKRPIIKILLIQTLLILIAFNKAWVHPGKYFFNDIGDGYKNYLTLYGYVADQDNGLMKFEGMNYPFGEYIFYTDNTPVFSVPLKLISRYLFDLSGSTFILFNLFVICGILFSSYLSWKILTRVTDVRWMLVLFSLTLPWLCPQFLRIEAGHFNLSFSWILLWIVFRAIRLEELWEKDQKRKIKGALVLFGVLVLAAFTHLYYLAIGGTLIAAFGFSRILWPTENPEGNWKRFGIFLGVTLMALVLVMSTIQLVDGYYPGRNPVAEGYGFDEWKLNFWALYASYGHLSIPIPGVEKRYVFLETQSYLGAFFWYGLGYLFLIRIMEREAFKVFRESLSWKGAKGRLVVALVVSGVLGACIALGEEVKILGNYKVPNLLNPFLYMHLLTDKVEQFRCIGRFGWFLFWGLNFWMIYLMAHLWKQVSIRWVKNGIIILAAVSAFEALETISFQNNLFRKNRITHPEFTRSAAELAGAIDADDFQAILPLPYFAAGSEVYPFTIDPPETLFHLSTQLYAQTGLPLMAYKMSRTSVPQTEAQLSMFLQESPDELLTDKLNNKDVLVLYDKALNNDFSWYSLNMEPSATVAKSGNEFLNKYQPEEIYQNGTHILYRLDVSKLKKERE